MKKIFKFLYSLLPLKKEIFTVIKQIKAPPHSVYQHLHFKDPFDVPVEDKVFKIHHFGFQVENEIFWKGLQGGWEKVSIGLWIELCRKSNCIIDAGANTGIYSLIAKTLNPQARVYAFEPVKRVFEKLELNCRLNKYDISSEEVALSNYDGYATIYDQPTEHIYSVTVNKNLSHEDVAVIPTQVRTIKLSSYIEENNVSKIDLVKIDVETHEAEVLQGFEPYLTRMRPALLIEILNDTIGKKVEKVLQGKGYLYFDIDEINPPKQVRNITKSSSFNYFICSEETASELNLKIIFKPTA